MVEDLPLAFIRIVSDQIPIYYWNCLILVSPRPSKHSLTRIPTHHWFSFTRMKRVNACYVTRRICSPINIGQLDYKGSFRQSMLLSMLLSILLSIFWFLNIVSIIYSMFVLNACAWSLLQVSEMRTNVSDESCFIVSSAFLFRKSWISM